MQVVKIWVTGAFNEKMLISHEDNPFRMVMQNKNGLAAFQHYSSTFGMVVQKFTCSCEIDFQATTKMISLIHFTRSCKTDTPLIFLCIVIFNHPYLPRFNSDLCIVWSVRFLTSRILKRYIRCPKMIFKITPKLTSNS